MLPLHGYAWLTTGAPGSHVRQRNWVDGNKWGQTPSHDPHLHPLFPISASLLLNTPGVSTWNTPTMLLDAAGHIEIVTSGTQLLSPQGLIFNLQPNRFPSHRPSLHSPTYTSLWFPSSFLPPRQTGALTVSLIIWVILLHLHHRLSGPPWDWLQTDLGVCH